jgi:hypothetical protein
MGMPAADDVQGSGQGDLGAAATLDDLEPVVRDPRFIHVLADVKPGQICYLTNRRDGVAFDPVIRDLAARTERALVLGDGMIEEATVSPDGRWLALTMLSAITANAAHVLLVDLTEPPGSGVIEVTEPDAPAVNYRLRWLPGSDGVILTSIADREFTGIARYDLATRGGCRPGGPCLQRPTDVPSPARAARSWL